MTIPGSLSAPLLASAVGAAGPFEVSRSLRFDSSASSHLNRTPSSAGNRRTWTWSGWVKRGSISTSVFSLFAAYDSSNTRDVLRFESNKLNLQIGTSGTYRTETTDAVFRDPSAWYHIVVAVDSTQSTAADRLKFYVNGVEQSVTGTPVDQNTQSTINNTDAHYIGARSSSGSAELFFDGCLAEVNFVDGSALDHLSFGEFDTSGVWQAKDTSGLSFGTNGFRLKFDDNSSNAALGTDSSGNSNTWTVNNLTAAAAGLATANQGFDVVTYTGNGGTQAISSLAFQPDFVWIKDRDAAYDHEFYDTVRGTGNALFSSNTGAELATGSLTSFDNNGFTVQYSGGAGGTNKSGDNLVAWAWKAGGAASSNTNGTITSSVSANNTYGFSIVSFTDGGSACTVGHGLSSAPKMIWAKFRGVSGNWSVYHESIGNDHRLKLNLTDAKQSGNDWWNATSPTSSVFSLGSNLVTSTTQIAYCWSEVAGFSKFGSYSGGTSNNTITLGFKPRHLLIKRTDAANSWLTFDSARGVNKILKAESSGAETTASSGLDEIEFLNDGFKLISTNNGINGSGGTYIYAAYASKPSGEGIDSLLDTPTNGDTASDTGAGGEITGNYATLNPLIAVVNSATYSNGNLEASSSTSSWKVLRASIGATSGKWLAEYTTTGNNMLGVDSNNSNTSRTSFNVNTGNIAVRPSGQTIIDDVNLGNTGSTISDGDVVGLALDLDSSTKTLKTYINGSLDQTLNLTSNFDNGEVFFSAALYATASLIFNFGQRAFSYPVSGYKSLNTANLPTPTIADGSLYFDTKLYTGDGGTQALTMPNSAMSPGFVWLKERSTTGDHELFDSVRGVHKYLESNSTNAESTSTTTLTSFNSNGFTLGSSSLVNDNNVTYAGWAWDAGNGNNTYTVTVSGGKFYVDGVQQPTLTLAEGSTYKFDQSDSTNSSHPLRFSTTSDGTHGSGTEYTTGVTTAGTPGSAGAFTQIVIAASAPTLYAYCTNHSGMGFQVNTSDTGGATNLDGTIASQVMASPESGFSIVSYSGVDTPATNTVGHGLNVAPSVYIIKNRTSQSPQGWVFNTTVIDGSVDYLFLNLTNAKADQGSPWNTLPTSSVFTLGANDANTCNDGDDYIAYCFAPVAGYSSIGSYQGNGSADGPFVYTGFRPAFVLRKSSSSNIADWTIMDQERDPINQMSNILRPNLSNAEVADQYSYMDILSNGFKVKSSGSYGNNVNGTTYIYIAFASNPFASNGGLAR